MLKKAIVVCLAWLMLCGGCCLAEEEMHIHGRPYWGMRVIMSGGSPQPVDCYETDGSEKFSDWSFIYVDTVPGYISPQLTFCGHPDLIPPLPMPGHTPYPPLRVWYSHTGLHGSWSIVDPGHYILSAFLCVASQPSILFPPFFYDLSIFDFVNADPYLSLPGGATYLLITESDPVFAAKMGISPKVTGVGPI